MSMERMNRIAARAKSEVTSGSRVIGNTNYRARVEALRAKAELEQAGRDFFEGKGNWA